MAPKRTQYIREERNGKVVYVPVPDQDQHPFKQRKAAPSRYFFGGVTQRFLGAVGWSFNVWFPPLAWAGASFVTVGLGWFAWQALTNPDVIFWVNQFTPGNLNRKIPADDQPKTISEILAQLERHNQQTGVPIPLSSGFSFHGGIEGATLVAIPILGERKDASCSKGCSLIQELRIYRTLDLPPLLQLLQRQRRFRSVNRMQVLGPSDQDLSQLIRTVKRSGSGEGSSLPLGMSQLETKTLEQDPNIWLILSGLRAKGNATASYGQILLFNPGRSRLSVMLDWLSPTGQFPAWKDMTGDGQLDIVIDQSIGLEPSFAVYEIKRSPNGAPWVIPVNLNKPALKTVRYQDALKLARSGLWTQSQQQLTAIKTDMGASWPASAQAQLGLVQRHANSLKSESDLAFSDPIEEIQFLLVQGAWAQAQQRLFESRDIIPAIQRILAADNGQIGDRIRTAVQVGGPSKAAVEWGIIYAHAKGGKAQAVKWINANQPRSASLIDPVLKQLTQVPPSQNSAAQERADRNPTAPVDPPSTKKSESL